MKKNSWVLLVFTLFISWQLAAQELIRYGQGVTSDRGLDQILIEKFGLGEIGCPYSFFLINEVYQAGNAVDIYGMLTFKDTYGAKGYKLSVANNVIMCENDWDGLPTVPETPSMRATCPDETIQMVFSTCLPDYPTAKEAVETNYNVATSAGYKCKLLEGSAESLSAIKNWLACKNLLLWGRVGHGVSSALILYDGNLSSTYFTGLSTTYLNCKVIYANSCDCHNSPFEPAVKGAGVQCFIGGNVPLTVGPSEKVFKCWVQKTVVQKLAFCTSVSNCETETGYTSGAHGCTQGTGQPTTWCAVSDNPPVANFTYTQTSATLTEVFTDTSTDDKGISAWLWNFGDSATSTVKSPSRTYSAAGTYTVSLRVTDTASQTNTKTATVVVNPVNTTNKEIFVACFSGLGVWTWNPNTNAWAQLNPNDASLLATGDIDGNSKDDLAGVYGSLGLYIRYDSGAWSKVNVGGNPTSLTVGDADGNGRHEIIGVWSGIGAWVYTISTNAWAKILDKDANQIASGDYDKDGKDEVLGWWSTEGLWMYDVADAKWTKVLDETGLVQISTGDMNGDARDDCLGNWTHGTWYYNPATAGWTRLYNTAEKIASGDLDGKGMDDLIGCWSGVVGVWVRYTEDGTWAKIHDTKPATFAAGKLY